MQTVFREEGNDKPKEELLRVEQIPIPPGLFLPVLQQTDDVEQGSKAGLFPQGSQIVVVEQVFKAPAIQQG